MPQTFLAEDHRIHKDLLFEIFTWMFLVRAIRIVSDVTSHIEPPKVRREVATGVRTANFHAGKTIQRSIENKSREEERRFERIPDDIAEIAASTEGALLDDVVGASWMHKHEYAKLLNLRPKRIVLRRRWHLASCMACNPDAAQSQLLDGFIQLLGSHFRMLQCNRR